MLSENKIQKSVNIVTTGSGKSVEVLWINQIIKNDLVLAETNHRCAYSAEDKEKFLIEVERAEEYLGILGW